MTCICSHEVKHKFSLKPGRYWIGDPCYIVPDDKWRALLDSCNYFDVPLGTIDEVEVIAFRTMYGDGTYKDQSENEYGVDAGLIGIVSVEQAEKSGWTVDKKLGTISEFKRRFNCTEEDGIITFGYVTIVTDGSEK